MRGLSILHSPVFLLNSCLDLFSAPLPSEGTPLSRSYGVNLPSSLTVNLSSALVCSTRPRVSVYGTGRPQICLAGFLGSLITTAIGLSRRTLRTVSFQHREGICLLGGIPTGFNALFRQCAGVSLLRRHIALRSGNGMFTVCPSAAPCGCALGPDLP